jgi:hypothetical protein
LKCGATYLRNHRRGKENLNRRKQRKQRRGFLRVEAVSGTLKCRGHVLTKSQKGKRGFEQKEAKETKGRVFEG